MTLRAGIASLPAGRRPGAPALWSYAALALPLAFALLPVYVHMPSFYAHTTGMSLAMIGTILLATRVLDAVIDPLIGRWLDAGSAPPRTGAGATTPTEDAVSAALDHAAARAADRRAQLRRVVLLACPILALGFFLLFHPPAGGPWAIAWLAASLVVTYAAFSFANIAYQGWGSLLTGDPAGRARVAGVREAIGLIGVIAAAALPAVLGISALSWLLLVLVVLAMAIAWRGTRAMDTMATPASPARVAPTGRGSHAQAASTHERLAASTASRSDTGVPPPPTPTSLRLPFTNPAFLPLFRVFILNGIASSIPATLIVFFVQDKLALSPWLGVFLAVYFLSGAAGMPVWLALAGRIGQAKAWLMAIVLSVACFVWAFFLGDGDLWPFLGVCIGSGLALGAELALPPALLVGVIARGGHTGIGEGAYFGLWSAATKLNLALAAGLVLPLLGWLGYDPNAPTPTGVAALTWGYTLIPCLLKLGAAASLWRSPYLEHDNDNT